ncbi:MAG TPA: glycosyltransferase [Allosphingosinicella sp.]|uniref:glycosyltransferase n=1 Tax=Allosphingosinicella sp. TaxID=2823234 RepID=UPI002F29C491
MKVLAAIVTYNRSKLLERCIDHILAQTRPPEGLVVINNSSTDDTEEMLLRRGIDFITQANLGGAGGFNRAVAYMLEQGYDAVWLMDDDGFPAATALERLTEKMTDDVACISSMVLSETDPDEFVFPQPALDRDNLPAVFTWPRKITHLTALRGRASEGTYGFAHLFNGTLISAEAIRKIGNVETGYFIFGDEVDYQMRLRKVGKVLSHLDAHHYHPAVAARPLSEAKVYYYIKNTMIINRRYFNRPALRNLLAIGAALGRVTARNGIREGLSFAVGSRSKLVRKAILRGLKGQVGQDFNA